MKKTFSRFQIAYIHVILLLLIMLSGWCVYITSLMLSVYFRGYAPKNRFFCYSHYKSDYSLHVSSNML